MTLRDTVGDFLSAQGWQVTADGDDLLLHCRGEHGDWSAVATVREEQAQVVFRSVYPGVVPEARLPATMELITRLNAGLGYGGFDLDLDVGALWLRTSLDVEFDRLSEGLLRSMVLVNIATMDAALPRLRETTGVHPARGPRVTAAGAWHDRLLRAAGRVPDDLLCQARARLAEGRSADVARTLAEWEGAAARVYAMAPADPLALAEFGDDIPDILDLTGGPSGAGGPDAVDDAAVAAVGAEPTARGLWRAWRIPAAPAPGSPKRIHLVEIEGDRDALPALTGRLQAALIEAGEEHPQVEAYAGGDDLPAYQRQALGGAALLWSAAPPREIRLARVFDTVDPRRGPGFDPDHPRLIDPRERADLLAYLRGGAPLLFTTAVLDDVVDPARRGAVPMNLRTDGRWIWTDTVAYYLEHHHLAPDAGLLARIRDAGYMPPAVDGAALHRAMAALRRPGPAEPVWTISGATHPDGGGT